MKEKETINSNEESSNIDEIIKKANYTLINALDEMNHQLFSEFQMLCSMVQDINKQIIDKITQEYQKEFDFKITGERKDVLDIQEQLKEQSLVEYMKELMLCEGIKIEIKLNKSIKGFKIVEAHKQIIEQMNQKFISSKMLMTIPFYFIGMKETHIESYKETLIILEQAEKEKISLLKRLDDIIEKIEENDRELSGMQQRFFEELPKIEDVDKEGNPITTTFLGKDEDFQKTTKHLRRIFKATIDPLCLFEMMRIVEEQYQISFKLDEEKEELYIIVEGMQSNTTNRYIDMKLRQVEELKKENEKLKQENQELKEEQIEETIEQLEDFKPNPIDKAIAFNDKLSNNFQNLENNQSVEIVNTGGTKKKSLQNKAIKVLVENGNIKTTKVLEDFDKVILQSIYSVTQKNQFFDVQMLKEQMSGNKHRHKTTLDDDIQKAIDKLRTTLIQIEIPEELLETMKGKTNFDKLGMKENILQLKEFYVVKGGHKKSVYQFTSKSIYFDYAEAKGQLISKDVKLLQGGIGKSSKESVVMIDYLTTRIEDMKHQKQNNKSNSYIEEIKFNTIWEKILTDKDLKLTEKSLANKKSRYKNQIRTILTTYKKDKYIKDFEEYSEGIKVKI